MMAGGPRVPPVVGDRREVLARGFDTTEGQVSGQWVSRTRTKSGPRLMPAHRGPGARSRGRSAFVIALVVAVVAAGAIAFVVTRGESTDPPARGENVLAVGISPVGGRVGDGVQTVESAQAAVEQAADDGAVALRLTADVSWLCSAPGECETAPLEPIVDRAGDLGLRVYLHVNSTPGWMDDRGTWWAPVEADAEVWGELFAEFVARFGTEVAGYEVWNEPNNEAAWQQGPDPEEYADLLKASWTAAKDVEPNAQVIGGALSNNDLGYMHRLSEALADRGGNAENRFFYDQLGVHPYAGDSTEGYDPDLEPGSRDTQTEFGAKDMTFRGLERLREQVAADEGIWRDVVIGEFGYDTTPGNWYHVPEPRRSEYLASALRRAATWSWVKAFTIYSGEGYEIEGTPSAAALRETAEALR